MGSSYGVLKLSLSRALRATALSDEVLEACRALGRLAARTEMEP